MANRLAGERSPYLRQHADNPVDWYPWGAEALERARAEDRPVLLSIGYSACHWCHVMAHESFEDPGIASVMNERFVNIKVDREERPDLDQIYMAAVQVMTGQGGWPTTIFCTPAGRPYHGGTYFPPDDRFGRPGFPRVLAAAAEAWSGRRDDCERAGNQVLEHVARSLDVRVPGRFGPELPGAALRALGDAFDPDHGGFGGAPKFPQAMALEFCLDVYARTGDPGARRILTTSLDHLAAGGIRDHLGGGFHRYATDAIWLVPHFEKMLYDNALLARLFLLAGERLAEPRYLQVARETLTFVCRELADPAGGFYSALDADSEGEEGKYYVWTYPEILTLLGYEQGLPFMEHYGVTMAGNWEGKSILVARPGSEPPPGLEPAREKLLACRETRVRPGRDEKVMAAWNGLMLEALATAARVLPGEGWDLAAERLASFLVQELRDETGLLRIWNEGQAGIPGFLEDHGNVCTGLLAWHEVKGDARWLGAARELADQAIEQFRDPGEGRFYDVGPRHEALVVRPRDVYDNATPSGNSAICGVLLRLSKLTGEKRYRDVSIQVLEDLSGLAARVPVGFGRLLRAAELALG